AARPIPLVPAGRRRAFPECTHSAAQPGNGDGEIQAAVIFNGTTGRSKIIAPLSVLLPADTLSGATPAFLSGRAGVCFGTKSNPSLVFVVRQAGVCTPGRNDSLNPAKWVPVVRVSFPALYPAPDRAHAGEYAHDDEQSSIGRQVDLVEHRSDGLLVERQVEHGSDLRRTSGQESRISSTTKAASEPLNVFLSRADEMSWTRTAELTDISASRVRVPAQKRRSSSVSRL